MRVDVQLAKAAETEAPAPAPVIAVAKPGRQTAPFIFASPHSGSDYPADFLASSRVEPLILRRTEDSFVDEIFAHVPALGAPLLKALFARAFCDPNREAYELDPEMFDDDLPAFANTASSRVRSGLGTIARYTAQGDEIYRRKLRFGEARSRIEGHWRPYHRALAKLIGETKARFGVAIVIDCHSMPSVGRPYEWDHGRSRADVILGDCHGASCSPKLIDAAESALREAGFRIERNQPYAGGYTTEFYGRPGEQVHALQIEINRALYMDEERIERKSTLPEFSRAIGKAMARLLKLDPAGLLSR